MKPITCATLVCIAAFSAACSTPSGSGGASQGAASGTAAKADTREVKSRDGSFSGEIVGKPAPGSKFAKLLIGMQMNEVQEVMGQAPDRSHTYESGKRWIPFYFGNDARRIQALFKNEGCLIFTGGNVWGGAAGDLVLIEVDPTGKCYQP